MNENAQRLDETASTPAAVIPEGLKAFAGGWEEHRNKHCIWIVSPEGYKHSHAFDEVADALSGAFAELGGSAPVVRDSRHFNGRLPIVYGANLLIEESVRALPRGTIIVNLEQAVASGEWFDKRYLTILNAFPVLDYSPHNCACIRGRGVAHAEVMEIGYSSNLRRIRAEKEKDIDVLFYGSITNRRGALLDRMKAAGLNVVHLFGVYGPERDAAIARAKVVLNVRNADDGVFEIVRVSYLLSNGVCVLTEGDINDPDIAPYREGMAIEPYDRLVERAIALAANPGERMMLGVKGWDAMRRRPQSKFLQAAIAG